MGKNKNVDAITDELKRAEVAVETNLEGAVETSVIAIDQPQASEPIPAPEPAPEPAPKVSESIVTRIENLEAILRESRDSRDAAIKRADDLKDRFERIMVEIQDKAQPPYDDTFILNELDAAKTFVTSRLEGQTDTLSEKLGQLHDESLEANRSEIRKVNESLEGKIAASKSTSNDEIHTLRDEIKTLREHIATFTGKLDGKADADHLQSLADNVNAQLGADQIAAREILVARVDALEATIGGA